MATVTEIVNKADPQKVVETYIEAYDGGDGWDNIDSYGKFVRLINSCVGVDEGEGMRVKVSKVLSEDDPGNTYYDVSGKVGDRLYAIEFTDWGVWKLLPVDNDTDEDLSVDQLAAHIYYEMTWAGWPEDMVAKRDSLADQIEEIQRDLDTAGK